MIRLVIWTLLLAAFVAVGLCGIVQKAPRRLPFFNATASTDDIARRHLELEQGTSQLAAAVAAFPNDKPLLVIGPGNDWRLQEISYFISYVAWPRPVWTLGEVEAGHLSRYTFLPATAIKPAAMFFYLSDPPPEMSAQASSLGPSLKIVPLPAK